MTITKVNGAKVEAGEIGEKPGMVVITAVDKKYTLLILMNCTNKALGRKDQL